MLNVPLPFLVGLLVVLVLGRSLKGVDAPRSRACFILFLSLYAVQGLIVGLHFGYGITSLGKLQPVTASLMPPMAYLAFRSLTAAPPSLPWQHLAGPVAVLATMLVVPLLIDPLLLVLFLVYGWLLWRLTGDGQEVMTEPSLQRMRPAQHAARLTAALMLFSAVSDAALAIWVAVAGSAVVPLAVTLMSLAIMVAVLAFALLPRFNGGVAAEMERSSTPEEDAIVAQVTALLAQEGLYRDENLSLARLARKLGLPARSLSASVNRATGLNISQFVNNFRVSEACRLLAETGRSTTAIMLEAGFSTKSNFNREFRRVTGQSPRQWRAAAAARTGKGNNGLDLRAATQQLGKVQRR